MSFCPASLSLSTCSFCTIGGTHLDIFTNKHSKKAIFVNIFNDA